MAFRTCENENRSDGDLMDVSTRPPPVEGTSRLLSDSYHGGPGSPWSDIRMPMSLSPATIVAVIGGSFEAPLWLTLVARIACVSSSFVKRKRCTYSHSSGARRQRICETTGGGGFSSYNYTLARVWHTRGVLVCMQNACRDDHRR